MSAYDSEVTHEYVIALHGRVLGAGDAGDAGDADPSHATAIAWAADRILAVGSDAAVRAISRGDSTFLDLAGCLVRALDPRERLEPGTVADLAFWTGDPAGEPPVATLRAGHFTTGDAHSGPFRRV